MIHLIVGNTGSGKTTYAHELKKQTNGIVFSIDKWNNTLFLPDKKPTDGLKWFLERIDRTEKIIMDLAHQLEKSKTDAILDLGLAKFEHREKFRRFAASNGYKVKFHFLDVTKDIRLARVRQRNDKRGDTFAFEVSKENFDFMESWFERPSDDELLGAIVTTDENA